MVVSLDPKKASVRRVNLGHNRGTTRFTDFDIGQMMLRDLAASFERHDPRNTLARNRPSAAAEELLQAARRRARRTGQTVDDVLKEHQKAIEDKYFESRMIQNTTGASEASSSNAAMHAAMDAQDQ